LIDISAIKRTLSHLILGQKGGQNRIQIIELLKDRPYNLNQLADILTLNYRTVKHHVDVLLKNELVSTSRTGNYGKVYFLTPEVEGSMDVFGDIVKKFEASKKLADFTASPKFFQDVMEQTNDAVFITDKEGQVLFFNKSAEDLFGYKDDEVLFKTIQFLANKKQQKSLMAKVQKGKDVVGFETKGKCKSGDTIDISVTIDAILDENDNILGYSIISRDFTERKRVENELIDKEKELTAILNNVPMPMFLVDKDRRVRKVNPATIKFSGSTAEEMIGLRGGEALKCLHSLDDPKGCGFGAECKKCKVRKTVLDTFDSGKSHHKVEAELPFNRSGKRKDLNLLVSTSLLKTSEKENVLVTIEDISELKTLRDLCGKR
jgi:PAS domain S-box-containing protein